MSLIYVIVLRSVRSCRAKRGHKWNMIKITYHTYIMFPVNEQWVFAIPKASELVSTVLFAACVLTYQTS